MEPILETPVELDQGQVWGDPGPALHQPYNAIPHFAYIEKFESGSVYTGISAGRGKFIPVQSIRSSQHIAFIVEKDRVAKTLAINIQSDSLMKTVFQAISAQSANPEFLPSDFDTLMMHYGSLRKHLDSLECLLPGHAKTLEFRLLVEDLLLDRAVFDGIGMEQFRQRGLLGQEHLQDIHERSIDAGLDEIDDCFALGLIPAYINETYLSALNDKYTQFALAGDFVGLYNLCEPIVRSGDIELQHNPSLLLKLLEQERFDIYWYLLDLVSRTREAQGEEPGVDLPDITCDPLHVAIRVGHLSTVESLMSEGLSFEGYIADESVHDAAYHVFTPLSAAVFWGNSPIVRYVLASGMYSKRELERALTIALSRDDAEMMEILATSGQLVPEEELEDDVSCAPQCSPPLVNPADLSMGGLNLNYVGVSQEKTSSVSFTSLSASDSIFHGASAYPSLTTGGSATADHATKYRERPFFKVPAQKRRCAHAQRQKLGRILIASLNSLCRRVRETLTPAEEGSTQAYVASHFSSFGRVWDGGLAVFRQLINNHPPRGLVEVLDCVVVASAMCTALCDDDSSMYLEFVNDLGRWKTILDPDERVIFDTIAFALWAYTDPVDPPWEREEPDGLARFQELIQDLVSVEREHQQATTLTRPVPCATRLSIIQKEYLAKEGWPAGAGQGSSNPMSIPIPGGATRKTVLDDAAGFTPESGDGFSINDIFDVDRFLAQSVDSESGAVVGDLGWNDILSTTVLLLASMAFSVVLILMTILHNGLEGSAVAEVWKRGSGYSRSCDILGLYFDSIGGCGAARGDEVRLFRPDSLDKRIGYLSLSAVSASSTRYTGSPPPSTKEPKASLGKRLRTSVMSSSPQAPLPEVSSSPEATRDQHPITNSSTTSNAGGGKRLRCLSQGCQKTFSSVSNRNKHMREGCPHNASRGGGERAGYRCRNGECSRVLTTKWYRNTHETERCRFRAAGVGGGTGPARSFG